MRTVDPPVSMGFDLSHRPFGARSRAVAPTVSLRPSGNGLAAAALACALSLAVGLAATSTHGRLALGGLAAAVAFVVLWRWNVGILLGALLIAQLGGLGNHPSKLVQTVILTVELIVMVAYILTRPQSRLTRPEWWVMWVAGAGLTWWVWVALRTIVFEGGTIGGVLGGGRDLAYIFVLAPLSMLVLKDRRPRRGMIAALAAGAAIFLICWMLYLAGVHLFDAFLNIQHVALGYGLPRLYSPMNYLGNLAAGFGIALALRGPSLRYRQVGALFAAAAVLVTILQLTRAAYFGLGAGATLVLAAWALQGRVPGQRKFRGRVLAIVAAVMVVAVALVVVPVAEESSTAGIVSQRVNSGLEELENGTGSVGQREQHAAPIFEAVSGRWLTGLGFWTPSTRYFSSVQGGEIRDGDLGVPNIYFTQGVIGVVLLCAPLLALLMVLMAFPSWGGFDTRSSGEGHGRQDGQEGSAWLMLGAGIWLAATLASSVTLGGLASRDGCTVSGFVIGLTLAVLVTTAPAGPLSPWAQTGKWVRSRS